MPVHVMLDYEHTWDGSKCDLPMLKKKKKNENGEADYNVWYHCMTSTSQNVVVTRTYGYTAWCSRTVGGLGEKLYAEKETGAEYVCINNLHVAVYSQPKLKHMPFS